jgi:hypothetical protein
LNYFINPLSSGFFFVLRRLRRKRAACDYKSLP